MDQELKILFYPDPHLRRISAEVEVFDPRLAALAAKMFQLMRAARGVGLAAAQVGQNLRLFIVNHTGKPEDDRVYVNPVLLDADGQQTNEEGCLSLPGINTDVIRAKSARIRARDLAGKPIEQVETGYVTRIWQHELDHLNGILIIDRMGPTARVENRKKLKDLEAQYANQHPSVDKKKKPALRGL